MHTDYKIVGTAGHIDHGKSAIVQALTGTDPDRLQEERERGITIDLGFAHTTLDDEIHVGFVDVPGHERFVKNMLAGIGSIDAVLFVVAADESIMPQTREHLTICELLGVSTGVVALTKCDLVDDEIAELVQLEVREMLATTGLRDAAVVRTSAKSGAGLDALRRALSDSLRRASARPDAAFTRMPIDRAFTMKGFGTVVTGTLLSGRIQAGDKLELTPRDAQVTVRGVQVYGAPVESAEPGQRTAVNLQGVTLNDVDRGNLLATPGSLQPTYLLDARLELIGESELEHLQRVRFHHGAAEILARVALLETNHLPAGSSGLVQLRLESPYACVAGDRFVVRRYSPMVTIGGGVILDNTPRKHRRADEAALGLVRDLEGADEGSRLAALVRATGASGAVTEDLKRRMYVDTKRLAALAAELAASGRLVIARQDPLLLVDAEYIPELEKRATEAIAGFHGDNPLSAAAPKNVVAAALPTRTPEAIIDCLIDRMTASGVIRAGAGGLALAGHSVELNENQRNLREALLQIFADAGWSPPSIEDAISAAGADADDGDAMAHMLLRQGQLVRLRDDLVFHREQLAAIVAHVRSRCPAGEAFTVADFKDWTGLSRKHAIPLLEHLDETRVSRREGDARIRI